MPWTAVLAAPYLTHPLGMLELIGPLLVVKGTPLYTGTPPAGRRARKCNTCKAWRCVESLTAQRTELWCAIEGLAWRNSPVVQ